MTTPVNAYSAITTRLTQDFGTLAAGAPATTTDSPTVISNGATTLSMTAGNFVNGVYELTLEDQRRDQHGAGRRGGHL